MRISIAREFIPSEIVCRMASRRGLEPLTPGLGSVSSGCCTAAPPFRAYSRVHRNAQNRCEAALELEEPAGTGVKRKWSAETITGVYREGMDDRFAKNGHSPVASRTGQFDPLLSFRTSPLRAESTRKAGVGATEGCAKSGRSLGDDSGAEDFSDPVRVGSNRARSFGRAARDGSRSTARARLQPPEARGPSRSPSVARPERRL